MAHTPSHNTSASQNLNLQQDLVSGFGNLPLGYAQGAFTLQDLADYVFPAAYEKIDTSMFDPEGTAALLDEILLQAVGSTESTMYQQAQALVSDVAAGTVDPELAASTLLLTDEGRQLSMTNPALSDVLEGVFASASKMGEDSRALQAGDVVQFDDGFYRRRSDKERNDLLADVGLDNALSNPDLYGFEEQARQLANLDRNVANLNERRDRAELQGGNAAKRLAEAESVMAAFLDRQEAERESRPGSRAATGARRPVQNAGVAAARDFDAGVPVESVIPDDLPDWLVEAGGPRLSGSQMVPPPMNPVSAQSRSYAGAGSRGRTVTSPAPYTDADLRRLRDEARSLEAEQKIAGVQAGMQQGLRDYLASKRSRYMGGARELLNEGLSQMGAAVAPAPRVSKPKIKLNSDTIARLVRGG